MSIFCDFRKVANSAKIKPTRKFPTIRYILTMIFTGTPSAIQLLDTVGFLPLIQILHASHTSFILTMIFTGTPSSIQLLDTVGFLPLSQILHASQTSFILTMIFTGTPSAIQLLDTVGFLPLSQILQMFIQQNYIQRKGAYRVMFDIVVIISSPERHCWETVVIALASALLL